MAILEVHGLHGRGLDVMLDRDQREYVIGRRPTCDVVIDHDDAVSREHLCVKPMGSGWEVTDLAARNGTMVNGEPLVHSRMLHHQDEVSIGRYTKLVFRDAQSARDGTTNVVEQAPSLTPGQRRVLVELLRPMYEGGGPFTMPNNVAAMSEALFVGEGAVKNQLGVLYDKYDIPPADKGDEPRRITLARVAYLRGPVSQKDYAKGAE